jgi:hypothetical protein
MEMELWWRRRRWESRSFVRSEMSPRLKGCHGFLLREAIFQRGPLLPETTLE